VELRLELGKEEKKDVERNGFTSEQNVDILKRGRKTVRQTEGEREVECVTK